MMRELALSTLAADPENPRAIDDVARETLGISLGQFGDMGGIVWNRRTGQLVCGHQRVERLTAAGARLEGDDNGKPGRLVDARTGEAFAVRVVDWPIEKQRAANLVANSPHLAGRYTPAALPQLRALEAMPSFSSLRLDALRDDLDKLAPAAVVEDETPAVPAAPTSQRGDLWIVGMHRLLCGDATDDRDVARLAGEDRAILMATDPPYGVDYAATKDGIPRSGFQSQREDWGDMAGDDLKDGALQAFLERAFGAAVAHALAPNAAWYMWHAHLTQGFFAAAAAAAAAKVVLHRQIIWRKPHMVLTRSGQYHWQHEPCFYGWRRGSPPPWRGAKNQTSVWDIAHDAGSDRLHQTQKPVALFAIPIANHVAPGEFVYEPFAGSGTQIIAAEQARVHCLAIEIESRYVDVCIERWQRFTGGDAMLDEDGRAFDAVRAARAREVA